MLQTSNQQSSPLEAGTTDSITLAQLKQFVQAMPKKKQSIAVKFNYSEPDTLEVEIDEFFSFFERSAIMECKQVFAQAFPKNWQSASANTKRLFLEDLVDKLEQNSGDDESKRLTMKVILHIALGAYCDSRPSTLLHLAAIKVENERLCLVNLFPLLLQNTRHAFAKLREIINPTNPNVAKYSNDLDINISILFLMLRSCPGNVRLLDDFNSANPEFICLLFEMSSFINTSTWNTYFPLKKVLVLLWRTMEMQFGTLDEANVHREKIRELYDLPPSPVNRNRPKTSIYEVRKCVDEVTSRFTGAESDVNVNRIPYANLLLRHNPFEPVIDSGPELIMPEQKHMFFVPAATKERIHIFRKNMHTSVASLQMCEEYRDMNIPGIFPISFPTDSKTDEGLDKVNAIEEFYAKILPHLGPHLITMLKVLLAVSTKPAATSAANLGTGRTIAQAVNDILSGNTPNNGIENLSSFSLAQKDLESIRNKELTAKAISFIILLLLKHSKTYHCLQFEYISQLLVDANFILLILKIFNSDVTTTILKNDDLDFQKFFSFCYNDANSMPSMNKSENPVTAYEYSKFEDLHDDDAPACRRNMFMVINLARCLQKLTKNKRRRVAILAQYKASAILKKVLKVEQAELFQYVLKVFKSFIPFLGRKLRPTYMHFVTLIYLNLRPELYDTWITAPDVGDIPVNEYQNEDSLHRAIISHYNKRKYRHLFASEDVSQDQQTPFKINQDGSVTDFGSILDAQDVPLDEIFMKNYEQWLEDEVFTDFPEPEIQSDLGPIPELSKSLLDVALSEESLDELLGSKDSFHMGSEDILEISADDLHVDFAVSETMGDIFVLKVDELDD